MRYQIQYHPMSKTWRVWRVSLNGDAIVVKCFKTQAGAEKWIARQ